MNGALVLEPPAMGVTVSSAPAAPPSRGPGGPVPQALRAWLLPLGGIGILAFLLWRWGTGAFLDGLRLIGGGALAAALGLGGLATVCCAWRWSVVARGLGLRLPLPAAVASCYRSVFLNATLPGGVLGDVHRAVRHGRDAGDVGRGIRAVVWERTAGQVVQLGLAMVVLSAFPSPVRAYARAVTAAAAAAVLGAVLLSRVLPRRRRPSGAPARWVQWGGWHGDAEPARGALARWVQWGGQHGDAEPDRGVPARWAQHRWVRALRTARADLRDGLLARRSALPVVAASVAVVSAHLATFLIAARTAGSTAPLSRLVPLTLLALLAMGLPANVAGFGPREGVAAWAFGAAGLTAAQGVATAVVYGALVLVSSLPGAAVLLVRRIHLPVTVTAAPAGAASG